MENKKVYQILDILIDEIKTNFFRNKARKILVELIMDEEEKERKIKEKKE